MFGLLRHGERAEHRLCRDNLSAYLDGQLSARGRDRVRLHLEQCEACRSELQSLQRTVALLHSLPCVKAPRSFHIPRTAPRPAIPFWMRPWAYDALRVATGAVAVFLVVALAGNALAVPRAFQTLQMVQLRATVAERNGPTVAPAEQPALAPTGDAGTMAFRAPHEETPSGRGEKALLDTPVLPTAPALGLGGGAEGQAPTLTSEEGARATAAPPGWAGGVVATAPTVAPEAEAAAALPMATPAPRTTAAPAPRAATEGVAKAGEAGPEAAVSTPEGELAAQAPRASAHGLRQRLAGFPWRWGAIASSALLSLLAAATAWLGVARSRWP